MSGTVDESGVGAMALDELIAHKRLTATGNAAGVRRVDKLAQTGSYRRSPPVALDVDPAEAARTAPWLDRYRTLDQPYDFVRCLYLRDAMVVGQGSVLTRDGLLLAESAAEALAAGQVPPGLVQRPGDAAAGRWHLPAVPPTRIEPPCLLLQRPWWRDYRHWLLDSAASLALALRLAPAPLWQILVGRPDSAAMRAVVADTCALLAPGVTVVERADRDATRVQDLLWISPPHHGHAAPFAHPEALAALRLLLTGPVVAAPVADRRVFLTQGAHAIRRLDNEAELSAIAASRGFECIDPTTLDLAGMVRLFRSARWLVGATRPAMASLFLVPAGGDCLMLSPADWPDPVLWDLACHAGVAYREAFGRLTTAGRAPGLNNFVIDPLRFAALLPT